MSGGRRLFQQTAPTLSAGIIPVYLDIEPLFLILRAYRYWDFPKGLVEKNETARHAALRELREEAGLTAKFKWGVEYCETEPYAGGKIARYYLAEATSKAVFLKANSLLGRPEHMEFRWLTYAFARRLLVPRVQRVIDWAHETVQANLQKT